MSKANLRNPEYVKINPVKKVVYFRDKIGEVKPVVAERYTVVNRSLYFYRKTKKLLSRGYHNGK